MLIIFVSVFITLSACVSVKLGEYPTWMFLQSIFAVALFYFAHWQTYVSGMYEKMNNILIKYYTFHLLLIFCLMALGTLRFGKFDVTETQLSIIFLHLMSAVFGTAIWDCEVSNKCYDV